MPPEERGDIVVFVAFGLIKQRPLPPGGIHIASLGENEFHNITVPVDDGIVQSGVVMPSFLVDIRAFFDE
jgi:hypothetical protein